MNYAACDGINDPVDVQSLLAQLIDSVTVTLDAQGAGLMLLGAGYILSATQREAQKDLTDHLQHALDSRVVIEQAKGILMGMHQLDARGAFEALQAARGGELT